MHTTLLSFQQQNKRVRAMCHFYFLFHRGTNISKTGLPADLEKPGNRKGDLEKGCNLPANLENSHKNLEKMFSVQFDDYVSTCNRELGHLVSVEFMLCDRCL